ncbi:HAMP domain-containing sensor histidine kinase [Lawsonibacter sp. LCP25S3_G6]|uniref:HAMP domain-containing sensor histidine kinase n=1 Tax=unclassified Lawsonibacter TaxID=2617946 RepID=UPI003F9DFB46
MSKRHSLGVQLFFDVLRSLLAAAAVFLVLFWGGDWLLTRTVYGESFTLQVTKQKFERLQEYVMEKEVTPENLRPLDIWCGRGNQIYLVIYENDRLIYESFYTSQGQPPVEDYTPEMESPEREFALKLSDGTQTRAFLYVYAGEAYYYGTIFLSALGAFVTFSLCFIALIHRKLRYIQQLKKELDILAGGDLSYEVTVRGNDELGELADGIDQMRRSIAAHQAAEERMRLANSELVTAMSHDLRTPLTSLLAYLELMERGKYENQEQLSHFIRRSLEKTLQIKSMADKLFEYVLVYSSEWAAPCLEHRDGDELLQHLLGEYAFSLENHGFVVQQNFSPLQGQLQVNLELLRRMFDNLYSNLLKYADPAQPVELAYWRDGDKAHISLSNRVSPHRDKRQSTNIGLNTCGKILRCHGGSFSYREQGERFQVEVILPMWINGEPSPVQPEEH